MKNGIITSVVAAIITYFLISENSALKITGVVVTLLALIYLFSKDTIVYNYYKSKIINFEDNVSKPFVNVNKVTWKILALIPNIDKMTAKHIVYNRRHLGNYKTLDDFFRINEIDEDKRELISKYIIV